MNLPRAILLVVLIVCGCAISVPTAAAPTPNTPASLSTTLQKQQTNNSSKAVNNSTLGAEISSFMQVSTSQAEGSVDTGLWVARFNQTKNKSAQQALVRHHVSDMQKRLSNLKSRKKTLVAAHNQGRISQLKYQSEMSSLVGEISSLQHAITATRPRAVTVGARVNELNKLDKQARSVGGPEVQEVAKGMPGVHLNGKNPNNSTKGPGTGKAGNGSNGSSGGNQTVDVGNGTVSTGNGTTGTGNGAVNVGTGNGRGNGNGNGA